MMSVSITGLRARLVTEKGQVQMPMGIGASKHALDRNHLRKIFKVEN